MEYTDFKTDFVNRTIEIIDKLSDKTDYEVTLLINCLFGLIVIPTEYKYHRGNYKKYEKYCLEKINQYSSRWNCKDEHQLVKCIKNSLSHLNFHTASDGGKISLVKFKDKLKDDTEFHTEIEFTVDNLKEFALEMAKHYLDIITNKE